MAVVAVAQITILDLNDAISAGTPPKDPTEGTLWIDTSVTPNVLKIYNAATKQWVKQSLSLSDLDKESWDLLDEMSRNVLAIADDQKITQGERIPIREKVMAITGASTIGLTLPTVAQIDTSKLGEVYGVRLEARMASLPITHASYTGYETQYGLLKTYLEKFTPRPWDTSVTGTIVVTKDEWFGQWKSYFEAYAALRVAISEQQKKNADEAEKTAQRLSTRGLGLKDGYSSFTTVAAGQIYFHGYNEKGNPADVDPYLVVQGVNKTIRKGVLNPGTAFDRGYLLYDEVNSSWYLIRTDAKGVWTRYNVGKVGHGQVFTFDDTKHYIVGYLSDTK